jgi:hypothetical protein
VAPIGSHVRSASQRYHCSHQGGPVGSARRAGRRVTTRLRSGCQHPTGRSRGRHRFPGGFSRSGRAGFHCPGCRAMQSRRSAGKGRCARFRAAETCAAGPVATGRTNDARAVERACSARRPTLGVERFPEYFRSSTATLSWTKRDIVELLRVGREGDVNFRTAAESFRLIDEAGKRHRLRPLCAKGQEAGIDILLKKLQKEGPDRWLLRKLQRYGVSIYQHDLQRCWKGATSNRWGRLSWAVCAGQRCACTTRCWASTSMGRRAILPVSSFETGW